MNPYDICVITAANSRQAEGYRKQLSWRSEQCMLPEETEFLVYADPQGKRIGSGGSTIYVLCKLLEDFGYSFEQVDDFFREKRILVLHSGGDSRRLPAYSAVGKIFTPLPTEKYLALFDVLLDNFMQLPLLDNGQVIVTSGDVLLSFEPDYVAFSDTGVTGVAYPDSPDVASNHGVYVGEVAETSLPNHSEGNLRKVIDFLQKPDYDELQEACALDHAERAFVDTGIMNFALDAVETLIKASTVGHAASLSVERAASSLCEQITNAEIKLDLYQEVTFAMLGKFVAQDSILAIEQFREIPFSVNLLPYCDFFHIGKSKEFLQNFHTITHASALYDFRNFTRSNVKEHPQLKDAYVYNTLIDTNHINLTEPVFIEGCHLEGEVELEGENILTGIPKDAGDISLQKGICLSVVPIKNPTVAQDSILAEDSWTSIIYGIEDSFKYTAEEDECSFLNSNFSDWMEENGISPTVLWEEDEPHELWNARLFPVTDEPEEAIRLSLALQDSQHSIDNWKVAPRMSLQKILNSIDYDRLLRSYFEIDRKTKLRNITKTLTSDNDLSSEEIVSWCHEQEDYETLFEGVTDLIEGSDNLLFQARLYKLISNITRETDQEIELGNNVGLDSEALEDKAFELIRTAIGKGILDCRSSASDILECGSSTSTSSQKIQIRSDEVVWVCAPARLDFAGGWSDTPPYCLEHGGSVLNTAVKLNNQYPIQVIGKIKKEPVIKINSIDLGEHLTVTETSEMLKFDDPSDWSSLPKSAFIVTGIIPVGLTPIKRSKVKSFFLFATVRNPLTFLVSYYNHAGGFTPRYRNTNHYDFEAANKGFTYLVNTVLDRKDKWPSRKILYPQLFNQQGECIIDWVNRTENLDEDLKQLSARFGFDFKAKKPKRVSKRQKPYHEYYSDELLQRVSTVYAREMKLFGYNGFETGNPLLETKPLDKTRLRYDYVADKLFLDDEEFLAID